MCGIVGFTGENAARTAVEKLKLLQYRGYDSAGVGFTENGKIKLTKTVGRVENLNVTTESISAIAHTRWATHGKVCERNAHPVKSGENWAVVHNGIIENYAELKSGKFNTDTDSEAISFLLEKYGEGLCSALKTARELQGSFAALALEKSGKIYALKNESPLFAAVCKEGVAFASDPVCFSGLSDTYYAFNDKECAVADGKNLEFYSFDGRKITKTAEFATPVANATDRGEFDTFMRKEIYDIPLAQKRIEETYSDAYLAEVAGLFERAEELWFIGCGTAYHACAFAESVFCGAGKKCRSFTAGEFRYADVFPSKNTLCVFVSQSGETADTLGALERVSKVCSTVALTNVGYSSLAKKAEKVLPTLAGCERSVASTKAYVCQIHVFALIAHALCEKSEVMRVLSPSDIAKTESAAKRLADGFKANELFVLGRKRDYVTAQECALKIKEVAYVNANAYPTGELKHGFIALLDEGSEVLLFSTDPALYKKNLSGAAECKSRGAKVTVVTTAESEFPEADAVIKVDSYARAVVFAQLFALECALNRNTNPDMPKNLAKSVTVE